jgi:hypothetical protein
MFVVTGDKSYLFTDYCPSRTYFVVEFTNGNGEKWFQLAYNWGFWTWYLSHMRYGGVDWCGEPYGERTGKPLEFDSEEKARHHLEREKAWLERRERDHRVTARVIG